MIVLFVIFLLTLMYYYHIVRVGETNTKVNISTLCCYDNIPS